MIGTVTVEFRGDDVTFRVHHDVTSSQQCGFQVRGDLGFHWKGTLIDSCPQIVEVNDLSHTYKVNGSNVLVLRDSDLMIEVGLNAHDQIQVRHSNGGRYGPTLTGSRSFMI